MKRIAQAISGLALIGTLLPPCLFFADALDLAVVKQWMMAAALVWFLATPFWMEHKTT
jgi:hypothetical protein